MFHLGLSALIGAGFWSDMAFDHFEVYEAPTCPIPTGLTVTALSISTADLEWTETGLSSKWNIAWGAPGFDPDVDPIGTAVKNDPFGSNPFSYQITGLIDNTSYQAYVQAECAPGDVSFWHGPVSFTTPYNFATYTIPFLEDFEAGLGQLDNAVGNTLDWLLDPALQVSGLQSAHNGPYTTNNLNVLFVTGVFDLTAYA